MGWRELRGCPPPPPAPPSAMLVLLGLLLGARGAGGGLGLGCLGGLCLMKLWGGGTWGSLLYGTVWAGLKGLCFTALGVGSEETLLYGIMVGAWGGSA